jgi:hypothetical protein
MALNFSWMHDASVVRENRKRTFSSQEDSKMVLKYAAPLFLSAALIVPALVPATRAAAKQDASVQVRVYDSEHKDYHNWDDNENRAWGQYLSENHKQTHDFQKADKKEQSDYWNWRHAHPDKDNKDNR